MKEDMPVVVVHMHQAAPGEYKEVDRFPMELSRNAGGIPLAQTRYAITGLAYHHPELFHTKSVVALHVVIDPPELHIYLDGPDHPIQEDARKMMAQQSVEDGEERAARR